MADPRFERAAIAVCVHDEAGALGVGLGDTLPGIRLRELYRQLDLDPGEVPDAPIHRGGPVEPQRGFVLHSLDWQGDATLRTGDHWALSGTVEILRALAAGTGPRRWVAALGYAGWGPGQLDGEMTRHGWLAVPASERLLFDVGPDARWTAAFAAAGIDSRMLSSSAGTA